MIEHLIISHHGQYDFGSPKLPMFPEALMLHYLDDLDSKMEAMQMQFQRGADSDGAWTGYNPSLGRPVLNTAKFLEPKITEPKITEEEEIAAAVEPPGGLSGGDVAPVRPGIDAEPEPADKEKNGAAMTSAVHEDKI